MRRRRSWRSISGWVDSRSAVIRFCFPPPEFPLLGTFEFCRLLSSSHSSTAVHNLLVLSLLRASSPPPACQPTPAPRRPLLPSPTCRASSRAAALPSPPAPWSRCVWRGRRAAASPRSQTPLFPPSNSVYTATPSRRATAPRRCLTAAACRRVAPLRRKCAASPAVEPH